MIEISVIDEADQQFGLILNNRRVTMRLRYNTRSDRWSFDLAIDDEPVIYGRRIVTGVDLLADAPVDLGNLYCMSASGEDVPPNRTNLPSGVVRLYHFLDSEIDEILAA